MVKKRVCEAWGQEDRMIQKVKGFTTMKERKTERKVVFDEWALAYYCEFP